ncbi:Hypothetical protein POVR1_LOCUS21 [uncultured virus]|nr:Hypothetical protein POVR1_LOCUS21 [uncultured virus]
MDLLQVSRRTVDQAAIDGKYNVYQEHLNILANMFKIDALTKLLIQKTVFPRFYLMTNEEIANELNKREIPLIDGIGHAAAALILTYLVDSQHYVLDAIRFFVSPEVYLEILQLLNLPHGKTTFPTMIQEIDSVILLEIDSLELLVTLYELYPDLHPLFRNTAFFAQYKKKYNIQVLNQMTDVLKLKAELNKGWSDEVGGRIIFQNNNYQVTEMHQKPGEKTIKFRSVTLLGDETIPPITHEATLKEYKVGKKMKFQWTVKGVKARGQNIIKYGIVLYNNGPRIIDLDSIFLRYITLPRDKQTSDRKVAVLNMLVSMTSSYGDRTDSDLAVVERLENDNQRINLRILLFNNNIEIEWKNGGWTSSSKENVTVTFGSWYEAHFFQGKYMAYHPYVLENRYEY